MKTILVTGGAGYLGSHCCKAFSDAGWRVVTYDNLSAGWRDLVRWGPLIEGDILDLHALVAAMEAVRPDAVAHLAALTSVAESVADPANYHRTNVVGTLNVLEAMRLSGADNLVFTSSAATYGDSAAELITEAEPQLPVSPYGWTKLVGEQMLHHYDIAYGLKSVALRCFNAAGADPDGEIGERHEPETHVVPLAARALLSGGRFTIFGDDFATPDGTAVRDYVHVGDLARGHLAAAEHLVAGGASDRINLGAGRGISVAEIVEALERVSGRRLSRSAGPRRPGDLPIQIASGDRAAEILGWRPSRSSADEIVRTAWAWHRREAGLDRRPAGAGELLREPA